MRKRRIKEGEYEEWVGRTDRQIQTDRQKERDRQTDIQTGVSRMVPACWLISLGMVLLRFLSWTLRPKSPSLMELSERKILAPGGGRSEGKREGVGEEVSE